MEKLGVEPVQVLTQLFNFLIMVFVLTKLLYKPILKALEERKKKIEEGLAYAEKMKAEMEKTEKKRQDILEKAKEEVRDIIEEGKKTGRGVEAEIIEKAHEEARSIIEKGKAEIAIEREKMEKELRKQTVDIAVSMVRAILSGTLTNKDHQVIIDKKIRELAHAAK